MFLGFPYYKVTYYFKFNSYNISCYINFSLNNTLFDWFPQKVLNGRNTVYIIYIIFWCNVTLKGVLGSRRHLSNITWLGQYVPECRSPQNQSRMTVIIVSPLKRPLSVFPSELLVLIILLSFLGKVVDGNWEHFEMIGKHFVANSGKIIVTRCSLNYIVTFKVSGSMVFVVDK